jgi:hypothetical protein
VTSTPVIILSRLISGLWEESLKKYTRTKKLLALRGQRKMIEKRNN